MSVATAKLPVLIETCKAAGAIVADRFVLGPRSGATQAGAGGVAIGVAESAAATGEYFSAMSQGVAVVEAGAAVDDGDFVQSDAQGRAVEVSSGAILGRARSAATAAGQKIHVVLIPVPLAP